MSNFYYFSAIISFLCYNLLDLILNLLESQTERNSFTDILNETKRLKSNTNTRSTQLNCVTIVFPISKVELKLLSYFYLIATASFRGEKS